MVEFTKEQVKGVMSTYEFKSFFDATSKIIERVFFIYAFCLVALYRRLVKSLILPFPILRMKEMMWRKGILLFG
jgi:hypothetical protein